jgi:hypothetical protein
VLLQGCGVPAAVKCVSKLQHLEVESTVVGLLKDKPEMKQYSEYAILLDGHALSRLSNLSSLKLARFSSDGGMRLADIWCLTHLKSLSLMSDEVEAEDLSGMSALSSLTSLTFSVHHQLSSLSGLSTLGLLQRLDLGSQVPLPPLPSLTHLRFWNIPGYESQELEAPCLPMLQQLVIPARSLVRLSLPSLNSITKLKVVDLDSVPSQGLEDADFVPLACLSNLQHLTLRNQDQFSAVGLQVVSVLTSLTHLSFKGYGEVFITEGLASISAVTALPQLQVLKFVDCGVSNECIKALSVLTSLTRLVVGRFDLSDLTHMHHVLHIPTLQEVVVLMGGDSDDDWALPVHVVKAFQGHSRVTLTVEDER